MGQRLAERQPGQRAFVDVRQAQPLRGIGATRLPQLAGQVRAQPDRLVVEGLLLVREAGQRRDRRRVGPEAFDPAPSQEA
jgi:hypothetical protein